MPFFSLHPAKSSSVVVSPKLHFPDDGRPGQVQMLAVPTCLITIVYSPKKTKTSILLDDDVQGMHVCAQRTR